MMDCNKCEYVFNVALGSYCALTSEDTKTTECHYCEQKEREQKLEKWLERNKRGCYNNLELISFKSLKELRTYKPLKELNNYKERDKESREIWR